MRRHSDNDPACLDDIREACALIMSRATGVKLPNFVSNLGLQDSIAMRLIVIGESASKLTDKTHSRYPDIKWREMSDLRNIIVHDYGKVDPLKIWKIIQDDVPRLLEILS